MDSTSATELGECSLPNCEKYIDTDSCLRTHPIGYKDNPALAYIPNLKHWYAYQMVYPLSLALVKASFLALYYRIFPPPNINRVLYWGTSVFIAVYTVIIIFVNVRKEEIAVLLVLFTDTIRLSNARIILLMHGRHLSPETAQTAMMSRQSITPWRPSTSVPTFSFSYCQFSPL
jgi:hypothetical protein